MLGLAGSSELGGQREETGLGDEAGEEACGT